MTIRAFIAAASEAFDLGLTGIGSVVAAGGYVRAPDGTEYGTRPTGGTIITGAALEAIHAPKKPEETKKGAPKWTTSHSQSKSR